MEEIKVPETYVMELKTDEEKAIFREFSGNIGKYEKKETIMQLMKQFNESKR